MSGHLTGANTTTEGLKVHNELAFLVDEQPDFLRYVHDELIKVEILICGIVLISGFDSFG